MSIAPIQPPNSLSSTKTVYRSSRLSFAPTDTLLLPPTVVPSEQLPSPLNNCLSLTTTNRCCYLLPMNGHTTPFTVCRFHRLSRALIDSMSPRRLSVTPFQQYFAPNDFLFLLLLPSTVHRSPSVHDCSLYPCHYPSGPPAGPPLRPVHPPP